ncbi:TULIP family P47-like protein [Oscillospiraceae bacterium PP1C4]
METTIRNSPAIELYHPDEDHSFLRAVMEQIPSTSGKQLLVPSGNAPTKLASSIETNGWDTVFAVRAVDLNRAIERKKTYPADVSYHYADEDDEVDISASFLPWAIVPGGDGSNINLKLPFQSGKITINNKDHSIKGGIAVVQVKLAYFPEILQNAEPGSYDLKVSPNSIDPSIPVVSIINYLDGETKLSNSSKGILKETISEWLTKNMSLFNNVFSTVTLEKLSENADYKWLKSTHMSYAYTDTGSEESSIFGVLCMTNQRSATGLPRQIDAACLKSDEKASYVIKKELFARYQFLPALPFAFEGASPADFILNKEENGITAKNLKLSKVKYGAINYYPQVENFEVWLEQSYIRTQSRIRTNISPGIDSIVTIITYQTLHLTTKDGKQYLEYTTARESEIIKKTEVAAGVIVVEVMADLILAIVAVVAGEFINTIVKKVIACIVIAIVAALISVIIHQIIASLVSGGVSDKVPPISPMAKLATSQILWPLCDPNDQDRFTLKNVTYNGSIILCGDPGYLS